MKFIFAIIFATAMSVAAFGQSVEPSALFNANSAAEDFVPRHPNDGFAIAGDMSDEATANIFFAQQGSTQTMYKLGEFVPSYGGACVGCGSQGQNIFNEDTWTAIQIGFQQNSCFKIESYIKIPSKQNLLGVQSDQALFMEFRAGLEFVDWVVIQSDNFGQPPGIQERCYLYKSADFAADADQDGFTFGPAVVSRAMVYGPRIPGDCDEDGKVEFDDYLALSGNFGNPGTWATGDFNGDGNTTFADFLLLSAFWGLGVENPPPPPW